MYNSQQFTMLNSIKSEEMNWSNEVNCCYGGPSNNMSPSHPQVTTYNQPSQTPSYAQPLQSFTYGQPNQATSQPSQKCYNHSVLAHDKYHPSFSQNQNFDRPMLAHESYESFGNSKYKYGMMDNHKSVFSRTPTNHQQMMRNLNLECEFHSASTPLQEQQHLMNCLPFTTTPSMNNGHSTTTPSINNGLSITASQMTAMSQSMVSNPSVMTLRKNVSSAMMQELPLTTSKSNITPQSAANNFTVSSALFYGDHSFIQHDVDAFVPDYPAMICAQDTPPSSPNNETAYSQSFYTSVVHENIVSQPIYNLSSQPHPNEYAWNAPSSNAMKIDDNLPNLQADEVRQTINTTKADESSYDQYKVNQISESLQKSFMTLSSTTSGSASRAGYRLGCNNQEITNNFTHASKVKNFENGFRRTLSHPDRSTGFSSAAGNSTSSFSARRPFLKSYSVDTHTDMKLPYNQSYSPCQLSPDPSLPENDKIMDNPLEFADPSSPESDIEEIKKENGEEMGSPESSSKVESKKSPKGEIHKTTRGAVSKVKKTGKPRLFSFLIDKLAEENPCIEWVNQSDGTFKFLDSKQIAHLWGLKKNKPNMQYENFARSLRTYIKKGILTKPRNKLVYQFAKLPPS